MFWEVFSGNPTQLISLQHFTVQPPKCEPLELSTGEEESIPSQSAIKFKSFFSHVVTSLGTLREKVILRRCIEYWKSGGTAMKEQAKTLRESESTVQETAPHSGLIIPLKSSIYQAKLEILELLKDNLQAQCSFKQAICPKVWVYSEKNPEIYVMNDSISGVFFRQERAEPSHPLQRDLVFYPYRDMNDSLQFPTSIQGNLRPMARGPQSPILQRYTTQYGTKDAGTISVKPLESLKFSQGKKSYQHEPQSKGTDKSSGLQYRQLRHPPNVQLKTPNSPLTKPKFPSKAYYVNPFVVASFEQRVTTLVYFCFCLNL